ncbi:MAG: branched-chain amino acid ABC transporter permease [Cyanobacteriota bacterium]|nr:branched-chain amino acid ABC transporter permease [Cyanobacteriota bacterium]
MSQLLQGIFNGISIGSVLLLAALGLAVVFGLMGVINLAHGELMMLGAYTTFVVQNVTRSILPEFEVSDGGFFANAIAFLISREMYIFYALIAAFIVAALVGLALEKGVIRFLYGRPLETLLATWGVSLILREFVRSVNGMLAIAISMFCVLFFGALAVLRRRLDWARMRNWAIAANLALSGAIAVVAGILLFRTQKDFFVKPWFSARNVDVTAPDWLLREPIPFPPQGLRNLLGIDSFPLPRVRLFIIALTAVCVLGTYLFLNFSDWGLRIRAVTSNRSMSSCLGIPTATVDALTFALGSGLAGIAGCAIALLGSVGPNTGQNYIVDTFMVVVVGGVGNLLGTIFAAMAIGTVTYLIGSGTLAFLAQPVEALKPLADVLLFFADTSMAKVMVFILIIVFLQFKPAGIFAPKGRTAEL